MTAIFCIFVHVEGPLMLLTVTNLRIKHSGKLTLLDFLDLSFYIFYKKQILSTKPSPVYFEPYSRSSMKSTFSLVWKIYDPLWKKNVNFLSIIIIGDLKNFDQSFWQPFMVVIWYFILCTGEKVSFKESVFGSNYAGQNCTHCTSWLLTTF